ncbi:MAG: PD40 domain-containing protein [Acidobacteria bacterium]|nr:PD40 domain-containing protein [Acidobacteriota bacterium]
MRTRLLGAALTRSGLARAAVFATLLTGAWDVCAQTPFVPYYQKNRIKYDKFDWQIYTTDHFEIYYYPELERHLERVAGYAESAYQQISADLKHDLAFKVPLVLFKTHSEFEQQNVLAEDVPEGVAAFAEPQRDRMVLPIDEPSDQLYGLIVHELNHIFEFDIIPRSLIRRGIPLWVDEGLSDYMRGTWDPLDLMMVRDAAVADIIPKMSDLEGYGMSANPRLIYNLGHAVFEFIESRWGKEGIRQFLFSLRKSVIGGGDNAYEEALNLKPDEFDEAFDKYLKDRFKPFRDKERPADYGKNLAPNPEKTKFPAVVSIEPSPSGDLIAAVAVNRKDGELDIVLLSAKDGQVIRNLTPGFDKDRGFEYIAQPSGLGRFNNVPWISWSPVGDRIAYFARTEKRKTLIIQNVLTRKTEQRVGIKAVDEPESPNVAPGGRQVAFAGLQGAVGDIFVLDLDTLEIKNVTKDDFADYAPVYSPDGKSIVYLARVSGNNKLFRVDLAGGTKTQLTFGTHDEGAAKFVDNDTLVFSSTAVDPRTELSPEAARNGNIYNLWTLGLQTGELRQYTDALGGNVSPVVLRGETDRIAFVTYYKGEYGIHTLTRKEPLHSVATSDFGAPGPIIDFQAPLTHTLITANKKKKGTFEKLFLEGRPPVNVGVTSGGDVFGGSQLTFTDVLGDQQFNVFAASISQYRTLSFSYINLARRFQYAAQGFSQTLFYYGLQPGLLFDPALGFLSRDDAIATRTIRGGSVYGIFPFNRYARLEVYGGVQQYREQYNDPALEQLAGEYQQQQFGTQVFRNGTFVPLGIAVVQETTIFREFGPLAGNTFRIGYEVAPKVGNTLSRQTFDLDARYYLRLATSGVLALRFRGLKSWGEFPDFLFYGGNSELRGYRYLEFIGHRAFFANAELRFPLIEAMATPIGVLGGIRGVFFFNVGAAGLNNAPFKVFERKTERVTPVIGYRFNPQTEDFEVINGQPRVISGFRLKDGRASYGIGLETFALGFPIHFDWSWRTLFNRDWEDVLFSTEGGSSRFRKPRFDVWIGYDF